MKKLFILLALLGMVAVGCSKDDTDKGNDNKIYYTTSDNTELLPKTDASLYGAILISNTYKDGQGVLVFDDAVTTIGKRAFRYCATLTSITIPDSVTTIGDEAFIDCRRLTSVTIGDSVTTIGNGAFCYCNSLTNVTIGDSVTTIGDFEFHDCSSLTSVYCKPTTPPAAIIYYDYWYAFSGNAPDRKIYVPMESAKAYKSAYGWSKYADAIEGYNF